MHDLPTTEPDLDAFLAAFEDASLDKARWTHAAHILTGACYVYTLDEPAAIERMRDRLYTFHLAAGGQHTASSGYHETITIFWIKLLAARLRTHPSLSRAAFAHAAVADLAPNRSIYADFYDFDVIQSEEARRTWIPPNVRPI